MCVVPDKFGKKTCSELAEPRTSAHPGTGPGEPWGVVFPNEGAGLSEEK